ncbi:hypothetical protein [Polaribacter sp. SA4-10]|nr:hypothetical protein [Polaribacter sp. SA4-10]
MSFIIKINRIVDTNRIKTSLIVINASFLFTELDSGFDFNCKIS